MRLLLLGATGLVGRTALNQALAKDAISEVVAPTRRPLVSQNKLVNPVNLLEAKDHSHPCGWAAARPMAILLGF
jgi:NAD dependent epimerase/dehydratase family enzyme